MGMVLLLVLHAHELKVSTENFIRIHLLGRFWSGPIRVGYMHIFSTYMSFADLMTMMVVLVWMLLLSKVLLFMRLRLHCKLYTIAFGVVVAVTSSVFLCL